MKGEFPMVVPETADGFQAAISALWSLSERKCEFTRLLTHEGSLRPLVVEKLRLTNARC